MTVKKTPSKRLCVGFIGDSPVELSSIIVSMAMLVSMTMLVSMAMLVSF